MSIQTVDSQNKRETTMKNKQIASTCLGLILILCFIHAQASLITVEVDYSANSIALWEVDTGGHGTLTIGFIYNPSLNLFRTATGNGYDVRDFTYGEYSQGDDSAATLVHNISGITFYDNGFINGAALGVNYFRLSSYSHSDSPYIVARVVLSNLAEESWVSGYAFNDDYSELNISEAVSAFSNTVSVPEIGTKWLFISGLIGLLIFPKRRIRLCQLK